MGGRCRRRPLPATLLGTTGRALIDMQKRLFIEMTEAFNADQWEEVVEMAEEGQAVAEAVRWAVPEIAAQIYRMLGGSFEALCDHVKGLGLLEQARALAVESGNRLILGEVCSSLAGLFVNICMDGWMCV